MTKQAKEKFVQHFLKEDFDEILDALTGMVEQHAIESSPDENGWLILGNALSSDSDALHILEKHGKVVVGDGFGRIWSFKFVDEERNF